MWGRKRRLRGLFQQGVEEGERRIDDEMRALRTGERIGDDTEPVDLDTEERASYQAGRNHARTRRGLNG